MSIVQQDTQLDTREKSSWYNGKRDDKKARPPSGQIINFTPLNTPLGQELMQIRDDSTLNWPERLKGDPNKWSREKYCRFHRGHGHDTSDYYKLKSQIESLIRKGKLQWFVRGGPEVQPPQGPEQFDRAEEWPRAPLGEIKVIARGTTRLMAE